MKVESESDPMDCSLPGSPVHGILQARTLEWGAIAFSAFPLGCQVTGDLYLGSILVLPLLNEQP